PRDELRARSLAGSLDDFHRPGRRLLGPYRYTTTDGSPSVWVDYVDDGYRWRGGVIRAPHADLYVFATVPEASWDLAAPAIATMLASVRVEPRPEARWLGELPPFPAPAPLLASRRGVSPTNRPMRAELAVTMPDGMPFERVAYASGDLALAGFQTRDPGDGVRHPAVLWVEGGFGGPSVPWQRGPVDNDQSAMDFVDAGFAVFVPSFRGELDNPGLQEMFFGETEDLLAALEHLRALPWVDPERIWLAGHSTGGTNVLLAAVAGAEVRGTLVFGGRADLRGVLASYPDVPFDIEDPEQVHLRSAVHWAHRLEHPVFWFEGDDAWSADGFALARAATRAPAQAFSVPRGDHFSILAPVRSVLIPKLLADDPAGSVFTVTEAELLEAMIAEYGELELDSVAPGP
ncbi:MAG: dienelactone hydrolase, partial [Myxococcota bacterium]